MPARKTGSRKRAARKSTHRKASLKQQARRSHKKGGGALALWRHAVKKTQSSKGKKTVAPAKGTAHYKRAKSEFNKLVAQYL